MAKSVVIAPPLKEMRERYRAAMAQLTDFEPVMAQIAVYLDRWNKVNFRTQGGNVGGWKPLASGGRWVGKGKRRRFDTTAKILQDTGRLRLSYIPFATSDEAGIGSDLDYAEAHNNGWGRLPARRMIPKREEVLDDVIRIADNHAKRALKKIRGNK